MEGNILMFKFVMVVIIYCYSYFIKNYRETNEELENTEDVNKIIEIINKKME